MLSAQYYASSVSSASLRAVCWKPTSRSSRLLAELLSDWIIRAAYHPSSHVVHVAAPRVHDPLEFCHVTRVKIWVNICHQVFWLPDQWGNFFEQSHQLSFQFPRFLPWEVKFAETLMDAVLIWHVRPSLCVICTVPRADGSPFQTE